MIQWPVQPFIARYGSNLGMYQPSPSSAYFMSDGRRELTQAMFDQLAPTSAPPACVSCSCICFEINFKTVKADCSEKRRYLCEYKGTHIHTGCDLINSNEVTIWGLALYRGGICASYLAAPGLILSVPKYFSKELLILMD